MHFYHPYLQMKLGPRVHYLLNQHAIPLKFFPFQIRAVGNTLPLKPEALVLQRKPTEEQT